MSRIRKSESIDSRVIRLRPNHYIHVLDNNTNVTGIEVGPATFIRKDHMSIVTRPTAMINIPPRHYCVVSNPHCRDEKNDPIIASNGQIKLRHADVEVRIHDNWKKPFPLYPGETLSEDVSRLMVIPTGHAVRVLASRDFVDDDGNKIVAGKQWLIRGPRTYIPRVEVTIKQKVEPQVVRQGDALKIRCTESFYDEKAKVQRQVGDCWLRRVPGSYLPEVYEEILSVEHSRVLTEKKALHLKATHTFTDVYGKKRLAGSEWLVTIADSQTHIPDVFEDVINENVLITVLTPSDFCVVFNPVGKDGHPNYGSLELRCGETSFFLLPGESLLRGIEKVRVLGEQEAILVRAIEDFIEILDNKKTSRKAGEEWMVYGPRKYIPPIEVFKIEDRNAIPLDENEGIYIRDKTTGKVRTVKGQTYMLKPTEEFWEKDLPPEVEELLQWSYTEGKKKPRNARAKHKMVTYRVPHNAAVQIYDYNSKTQRVKFGPCLVCLEPEEHFCVISLSGGEPKQPNFITSLSLMLGPDFMGDTVVVETSDHARLRLRLSYNWKFDVDEKNSEHHIQIFSVRDFVGDACKAIASRVRGAVASYTFEAFHKASTDIITSAVFGKGQNKLMFNANRLLITNIDIQSVEPIEKDTRSALQKSVQMAIEISTNSQKALAAHEAQREEQIAEGKLQKQQIKNMIQSEEKKMKLVELKCKTATAKEVGKAKGEALARTEAKLIQARAEVKQAKLRAEAATIRASARLEQLKLKQKQQIDHQQAIDILEIEKAARQAQIESEKFKNIVTAIGPETIEAIAQAGPEMQAKLLEGLGLEGFLVTDGTSPINLFNTANGLVGSMSGM